MENPKKMLYSNTFCAYRDKYMNRTLCRHKYSYGICDLDLCPIINKHYANVIFQPEGLTLVVKYPSEEAIAGTWEKFILEVSPELDNEDELIKFCMEKADGVPEKIKKHLELKIRNIFSRWRFLKSKGKKIGILVKEEEIERPPIEEELIEEIKEAEKEIERPREEELEEEIRKIEKELEEET